MSTQTSIGANDGRIQTTVTTSSTGPFAVDFPFFGLDEVVVTFRPDDTQVVQTLVRGVDYTLAATANDDGIYPSGVVTLISAVEDGTLTRYRETALTRVSQLPLTGYLDRTAVNADLNRMVAILQDLDRRRANSLRIPEEDGTLNTLAGSVLDRQNRLLAWDGDGALAASTVTMADIEGAILSGLMPGTENIVGTLAALASVTVPADVMVVQGATVAHDGGGGVFTWKAGATNTADGVTIINPTLSLVPGRFFRQFGGKLFFGEWFGMRGDDATANTTQIEAAIAAMSSAEYGSGTLVLADGLYRTAGAHVITTDGICIVGNNPYKCRLVATHASADIICFGTDTLAPRNCRIRGVGFSSSVTRSGGAYVRFRRGLDCELSAFYMTGGYYGVEFNATYQCNVHHGRIEDPVTTNGVGLYFSGNKDALSGGIRGSDIYCAYIEMAGPALAASQPQCGVYLNDMSGYWFEKIGTVQMGTGCLVAPDTGDIVEHGFTMRCTWDTGAGHGMLIQPGGGTFRRWTSLSDWFSSNAGRGITCITGTGAVADLGLIAPQVLGNVLDGMKWVKNALTILSNIRITDAMISGNSATPSASNDYDGLVMHDTDRFKVCDGRIGQANGFDDRQRYNVSFSGTTTNLRMNGVDIAGGATGPILAPPAHSVSNRINDCLGWTNEARGLATGLTTDGSGDVTISHLLSDTPTFILAQANGGASTPGHSYVVNTHTYTTTTFKVRVYDIGALLTSTAISNIGWKAYI
jgi:hypothetical protein